METEHDVDDVPLLLETEHETVFVRTPTRANLSDRKKKFKEQPDGRGRRSLLAEDERRRRRSKSINQKRGVTFSDDGPPQDPMQEYPMAPPQDPLQEAARYPIEEIDLPPSEQDAASFNSAAMNDLIDEYKNDVVHAYEDLQNHLANAAADNEADDDGGGKPAAVQAPAQQVPANQSSPAVGGNQGSLWYGAMNMRKKWWSPAAGNEADDDGGGKPSAVQAPAQQVPTEMPAQAQVPIETAQAQVPLEIPDNPTMVPDNESFEESVESMDRDHFEESVEDYEDL
jgi:hypothetical protein